MAAPGHNGGGGDLASSLTSLLPGLLEADAWASVRAGVGAPVRRRVWTTRFMPEQLYEHYARRAAVTATALPAGHPRIRDVPAEYVSVLPLDAGADADAAGVTGAYGYVSSMYKGVSVEDGMAYALRRVDNVRAPASVLDATLAAWGKARHPGIVSLRRIMPNAPGGAGALFFVHDYHPGGRSLREAFLDGPARTAVPPIPEPVLWSYVCQLVAALRAAHDAGVAFRGLHPCHVMLTDHNRVRITGAGVLDVLESDTKRGVVEHQHADLLSLGHLILSLVMRSAPSPPGALSLEGQLKQVGTTHSPLLHHLLLLLLSRPTTVAEVTALIAPKLLTELDGVYDHADAMDEVAARECDNGRLLRALLKLGFINERPAYEGDPSWSETGDRYTLKLYRDFLFHQVNDEGRAVIDVAHVVDSLNRLDRGSSDRILLCARDGGSLLVTSYAHLRRSVNTAFDDLHASHHGSRGAVGGTSAGAEDGMPYAVRKAMGLSGGHGGGTLPGRVRSRAVAYSAIPINPLLQANAHLTAFNATAASSLLPSFSASSTQADAAAAAAMMGQLLSTAGSVGGGGFTANPTGGMGMADPSTAAAVAMMGGQGGYGGWVGDYPSMAGVEGPGAYGGGKGEGDGSLAQYEGGDGSMTTAAMSGHYDHASGEFIPSTSMASGTEGDAAGMMSAGEGEGSDTASYMAAMMYGGAMPWGDAMVGDGTGGVLAPNLNAGAPEFQPSWATGGR